MLSALQRQGKNLAEGAGFGRYPLHWTSLAVPNRGGTLLEAFEPERVAMLNDGARQREAAALGARIARAVMKTGDRSCAPAADRCRRE